MAFLVLALFVVLFVPGWIVPSSGLTAADRVRETSDLRTNLVQLFAGAVVLAGLYFTLQSVRINRLALLATTDNQLTERYAKSLELAASDKPFDIRLGGILALGRLAKGSPADRRTIIEFLCALLVRSQDAAPGYARTAGEIEAMIRVIGEARRLDPHGVLPLANVRLKDLQPVALRFLSADLSHGELQRMSLQHSDLRGSCLAGTTLTDVDLRFSDLSFGMARGADFAGSDISWCNLSDAVFLGANLSKASLVGATLNRTLFIGADLRQANLRGTNLEEAVLVDADLRGAVGDANTRWPANTNPAALGVVTFRSA